MASDVEIVDVTALDDVTWTRLCDEVLKPSFPPAELVSDDELFAYTDEGNALAGMAAVEDGEPVGVVLGDFFLACRVALLSYLACRPDRRGRGIGGRLLATAVPRWWREARPATLVLEVEDPRHHTSMEHGDPVARLRFYAAAGARLVDLPFTQPSLRPGSPRVPHLLLLEIGGSDESISASTLAAFVAEYYEGCEGPDVVSDPEYQALVGRARSAPDGRIALLPPRAWPPSLPVRGGLR